MLRPLARLTRSVLTGLAGVLASVALSFTLTSADSLREVGATVAPNRRPAWTASTAASFTISLSPVVTGVTAPVYLTHAGDGSGRLFVVEQAGRIRLIQNSARSVSSTPFLSITDRVRCCVEEGLLSVAFPPDYASSGQFYVYYTDLSSNLVIARYGLGANPNVADPSSEQIVLTVTHPRPDQS